MTIENTQLANLIKSRERGGYTLPAELVDAYELAGRAEPVLMPAPEELNEYEAAAQLLTALREDRTPDLDGLVDRLRKANTSRDGIAPRLVMTAVEQANSRAVTLAQELADAVVVEHLRPAQERLLEEAAKAAAIVTAVSPDLDLYALVGASTKVGQAYQQLRVLADRWTVLRTARRYAITLSHRPPQQDVDYLFATFRRPLELFPGWRPGTLVPALPFREDPVANVVWIATDAQVAQPWMPTVEEQDAAWSAQFGEYAKRARAIHDQSLAISGR